MNKIHPSWKKLKPLPHEGFGEAERYISRISQIKELNHIPACVLAQWIHPHYQNTHMINNYAWINYYDIQFELVEWSYKDISHANTIKDFSKYTNSRKIYTKVKDFPCINEDKIHWEKHRTWKTPPIILDINSLPSPPSWSELHAPLQLVEGHSRMGLLTSMKNSEEKTIAPTHKVFIMRRK